MSCCDEGIMHASTPPVHSSQLEAAQVPHLQQQTGLVSQLRPPPPPPPPLCASGPPCCFPAHTGRHISLFIAVDFQYLLVC